MPVCTTQGSTAGLSKGPPSTGQKNLTLSSASEREPRTRREREREIYSETMSMTGASRAQPGDRPWRRTISGQD
jgi:hypothetical protein